MAFVASEYAEDIRANYRDGFTTPPNDEDGLFRDIVTDLFMDWDGCGSQVIEAYERDHGHAAPSEVEALAWAVAEIYEDFVGKDEDED